MVADAAIVRLNVPLDVRPLRDWVLLRERARGETPSGVIIPETSNSPRLAAWEVIAIGPEVKGKLKVGDAVVVQPAFAMRAPIEGKLHALIAEEGIVAVVLGDSFGRAGMIESGKGFVE